MKNNRNICLNCDAQLDSSYEYCPNCGQEATFKDLSLKYLLLGAIESFFNFDTKFFRTIRDVWIPNRINKYFIQGKRKVYMHPMRFLFICLVIFFGLLSISLRNMDTSQVEDMSEVVITADLYDALVAYNDSISFIADTSQMDSLKKYVFNEYEDLKKDTFFEGQILGVNFDSLGVITYDVYHMDPDSLWAKYNITSKKEKLIISQIKRVSLDPNETIRFGIANMLWGFIIITILMAFLMKLLYIRHDIYYVEHLMQINIFHCQLFLIFSLLFGLNLIFDVSKIYFLLCFVPLILLVYSWKDYYQQNFLMTIIKIMIFSVGYSISLIMVFILIALLSFMVY